MTRGIAAGLAAAIVAAVLAGPGSAAVVDVVRGSGVELTIPEGWTEVEPARKPIDIDPHTLVVVGTKGVRAVESPCLVASYRVPADGAAVVVVGWRVATGGGALLPLSSLRLRRATFTCFAGRGAVAQASSGGRDYQVNVLVGDRADARTVARALAAARSFATR